MSNKAYDTIKLIALIGAPVIVFITALLSIWNVPFQAELAATLAAVDALLGGLVAVLSKMYNDNKDTSND